MASHPTVWELAPHTKAKHEILRRYLGAWFPILTARGWNQRVIFLDGFAGPGRYQGGEPGSPIIALDTLVRHPLFDKLAQCEFVMIFVESDAARVANLEQEIDAYWKAHGGAPSNVKIHIRKGTFADTADEILTNLESQQSSMAPTFAFVDPFGFKGVPLDITRRLLRHDKCEVFFNLMYDSFNRFITSDNDEATQTHLTELFGTNEYRLVDGLEPDDRQDYLHGLFERQLHDVVGCRYTHHFRMKGSNGHNVCSLFFGTKNIKGIEVMKEAMWGLDPASGMTFSDRLAGQDVLFQPQPNFSPLRQAILDRFAGQARVPVEQIEHYVLAETPYKASHYKKQVLKPLQIEGKISAVLQKSNNTYPPGTVLSFA
jgi:three-Cys-motif partner protein